MGDAELAKAAQSGEAASLGILLERHRAPLYALALRILGHGPQAQDAVQDTFLIALRSIDRLREPEAAGGWLRGILRNVCLARLKGGQGEVLFDELPGRLERSLSEPSAEEAVDQLAMREWVWTALSELPEDLRVTAMLRYFGSYVSYAEIAAILGVPIGTVGSRLSQIKIKLADALLKTAGLEHDEARRLNERETGFFEAAFDEYNRGEGYQRLLGAYSEDLLVTFHNDPDICGRQWMWEEFEGDLEVGMKLHLTNVIASKGVTVVEGDFENPRDKPFRCPPAISFVNFYRGDRINLIRMYFAPRLQREGEETSRKP